MSNITEKITLILNVIAGGYKPGNTLVSNELHLNALPKLKTKISINIYFQACTITYITYSSGF